MADAHHVTINLELLQEHFIAADNRLWTADEVNAWLEETGFREQPDDRWLSEDVTLEALDRSEIVAAEPL